MKKAKMIVSALLLACPALAGAAVTGSQAVAADKQGNSVTVSVANPQQNGAKVVRLQVINDNIIRVQATSEAQLPQKQPSLMIVPQKAPAAASYSVTEEGGNVVVKTAGVKAVVSKQTGEVEFFDAAGRRLLKEADGGKQFWPFTVP